MLTQTYIEALFVDKELADQVWDAEGWTILWLLGPDGN